jgi:hypothetical protein
MYTALNLLSLLFIALGICYTAFYGFIFVAGKGVIWGAVAFCFGLFFIGYLLRLFGNSVARQMRIESKLDQLTQSNNK